MKKFYQNVNMDDRKAMVEFLKGHFRYNTASSWNQSTSYANNMKIYNLGLTKEQVDRLYDIMNCDDAYDNIHALIDSFGSDHDYKWQTGWNGRNGGYLVLYQGEKKPSGYKSYCQVCFQRNYKTVEESGCKCGRCRRETRINFKKPPMMINTFPGKSTDMYEDFNEDEWSMDDLRERVKLVQEFDKLCDNIVSEAAWLADNAEVEEEEYTATKTRKVLNVAV